MNDSRQCPSCGLTYNCLCSQIPAIDSQTALSLLMHENEQLRDTNTGRWLLKMSPSWNQFIWQRKAPASGLQAILDNPKVLPLLIFPDEDNSISLNEAEQLAAQQHQQPHFIILDGTWQEARKMNRKSRWLEKVQRVHITPNIESKYQLRRNQNSGELCTLEITAELLAQRNERNNADQMLQFFDVFTHVFKADKSGHRALKP